MSRTPTEKCITVRVELRPRLYTEIALAIDMVLTKERLLMEERREYSCALMDELLSDLMSLL
jgi:hypothetical protein